MKHNIVKKSSKNEKGFTLLEVMVALFIISIVLVALLKMEVNSISLATRTSITFQSLVIATRELDELISKKFSGEYEKPGDPFSIKAKSELTSKSGFPLDRLKLEVIYEDKTYTELDSFTIKTL